MTLSDPKWYLPIQKSHQKEDDTTAPDQAQDARDEADSKHQWHNKQMKLEIDNTTPYTKPDQTWN